MYVQIHGSHPKDINFDYHPTFYQLFGREVSNESSSISGILVIARPVEVAYGHHPCSVNIYVPLTPINRTSSLFLETCLAKKSQGTYVLFLGRMLHESVL